MKKWKEMDEKQRNIIEIIIGIAIIIIFLVFNGISSINNAKKETELSKETTLVKDNSRYFTALSCAQRYIESIAYNKTDDVLILLNNEYKGEYGINKNNLNNFIPKLNKELSHDYVGGEMYSKKISKNVTEYYIKGKIKSTEYEAGSTYQNYDLTVILYENTLTFSIRPGVKL